MVDYKPQVASASDATREREKVLGEWQKLTKDELGDQKRMRDEDMLRQVAQQTLGAMGTPAAMAQTAGSIEQTARMGEVGKQGEDLNRALTEAGMAGDLDVTRKGQAAKKFQFEAANRQQEMARNIADSMFEQGIQAKKLVMSNNAALADAALDQMKSDFDAGRTTAKEIEHLGRLNQYKAQKMKSDADELLKLASVNFEADVANGNFERAKSRVLRAIEAQLDALETMARAANIGSIVTGTVGIATAG